MCIADDHIDFDGSDRQPFRDRACLKQDIIKVTAISPCSILSIAILRMFPASNIKYEALRGEDEYTMSLIAENESLKHTFKQQNQHARILAISVFLTSIIAFLSLAYITLHFNSNIHLGAHLTDLAALHSSIEYEEREFDGVFKYNPSTGVVYRDFQNTSQVFPRYSILESRARK
jgi:zona occludens toxin (predicted ATPase)